MPLEVVFCKQKFTELTHDSNENGVGVVQNICDGSQQFYQGHRSALSSIALHPCGNIVATADIGKPPSIHVWSVDLMNCLSYLVGFHDYTEIGSAHVCTP